MREIQALRRLSPHEHIVALEEVLYDQPTGRLALVFELMDANLYELIKGRKHYLNPNLVKSYMWQLMKSLDHMHKKGIFHRDIKPENILIEKDACNEIGRGLKLADFGSCRGIYSKQPYTEYISTRWYRAPECLLTDGYYGPEMDLWGAGCVMFEISSLYPLFPGTNELDQINRIHKILGTPNPDVLNKFKAKGAAHISFDFPFTKGVGVPNLLTHVSADTIDLVDKLLKYDWSERISAREAMRHPYFKDIRESEAKKAALLATANNENNNNNNESSRGSHKQLNNARDASLPHLTSESGGNGDNSSSVKKISNTKSMKQQIVNEIQSSSGANASLGSGLPPINSTHPVGPNGLTVDKLLKKNNSDSLTSNSIYSTNGNSTYSNNNNSSLGNSLKKKKTKKPYTHSNSSVSSQYATGAGGGQYQPYGSISSASVSGQQQQSSVKPKAQGASMGVDYKYNTGGSSINSYQAPRKRG